MLLDMTAEQLINRRAFEIAAGLCQCSYAKCKHRAGVCGRPLRWGHFRVLQGSRGKTDLTAICDKCCA